MNHKKILKMGCDIHGFCEVKENGVWRLNTEAVFKNGYYLSDEELEKRRKDNPDYERSEWQMNEFDLHPSDGRNYDWFAILADVRNGRGFAGIKTGLGFDVITEPRGVPEDATQEWKDYVERWDCDMHSKSFLYLEDFDNFNWNQTTTKEGVISLRYYEELRGTNNTPDSWSGWVGGPNIVVVEPEDADQLLEGRTIVIEIHDPLAIIRGQENKTRILTHDGDLDIHVNYSWEVKYSEWFDFKIKGVIEPMRKLKEKYEDVRYVFGFDN